MNNTHTHINPPAVSIVLDCTAYNAHDVQVTLKFVAHEADVQLWLPTWIPGSYLMREFAKHIGRVHYQLNNDSQQLLANKTHKNQWQIHCQAADVVTVSYTVYAYDLSVRGAYVDQYRCYINPAAVCMTVSGVETSPINVDIRVGGDAYVNASLACALYPYSPIQQAAVATHGQWSVVADNYQQLIDSPMELAAHQYIEFNVGVRLHRMYFSGVFSADLTRLQVDVQAICSAQIALFGDAPFDMYTFMTMVTANDYGGLEHTASTSLIIPRTDLPTLDEASEPSESYQRLLGLCSHEYFHAWLVKTIRAQGYNPPNLHSEGYTDMLWVFEGITSYYDDLMLYRSGVISVDSYIKVLSAQITRYLQTPGRLKQSLAESSFDAWIKYYRPDENSAQSSTSYYVGGSMLALCLDIWLQTKGHTLDEVLRRLYQTAKAGKTLSLSGLTQVLRQYLGEQVDGIVEDYICGVKPLPLETLLSSVGAVLTLKDATWPFGLKVKAAEATSGLYIEQVLKDSVACAAGLSAKDTIVAINHIKASHPLLCQTHANTLATHGQLDSQGVSIVYFRRDELYSTQLNGLIEDSSARLLEASIQFANDDATLFERFVQGKS